MDVNQCQKDGDHDTDGSEFDPDFKIKLEPLPRAADIIAELPGYPVRNKTSPDKVQGSDETPLDSIQGSDKIPPDKVKDSSDKTSPDKTDDVAESDSDDEVPLSSRKRKSQTKKVKKERKNDSSEENKPKISEQFDAIDVSIKYEERNVVTENTVKKRAHSPIISPVKGKKEICAPRPRESLIISPMRQSKRQRIEGPKNPVLVEPKVYNNINRAGEFVTGFDPMSADAKYRRQLRMKRFGKHEKMDKSILDETMVVEDDNTEVVNGVKYDKRPEAIHLFGTDDLSKDDILDYFTEFSPHHIEWLNKSHCNVVWSDVHSVKRALFTMSYTFTSRELEEKKTELRRREKDDDEFYLLPGTLNRPADDDYKGVWRLAVKDNPKAHLLFMRFANTGDVKKPGAYLNSRYYSRYKQRSGGSKGISECKR